MKWANQRLWYYLKSFFGVGRNKAGRSGHEAGYHVLIVVGIAADAAVPPWVGYNEEEQMKAQILELSADSRNVLRNPPPGVQFNFDFARSHPIAMATLREDSRLQKLRFELVPKK